MFTTISCEIKTVITILTSLLLLFGGNQVYAELEVKVLSDLPNCGSGIRHNCFDTATYHDGRKYVGEWKYGLWHGRGMVFEDGTEYVGEFKNDLPHGSGSYTDLDGYEYVGEFRAGIFHGRGTLKHPNKGTFVGEFRDGLLHGLGTVTFAAGDILKIVSEFRDGKYYGRGTIIFADGSKYVGEIMESKSHGRGTRTFADGSTLQGMWEDGEFLYEKKPDFPEVAKQPPKTQSQRKTDPEKMISASSGSGFAITNSGHVITNNHVIEGFQNVKIHSKGQTIPATVLTFDPKNDIALLKGDFRPTTVFPLSGSKPELLQDIYIAGYPFGQKVSTSVKVTKGIVSSLTGIGNNFSNIQIDAALQPGNSGGPILDEKGNVIGVAVAKLDLKKILEDYGTIPENTNFGVKTSVVRSITDSFNVSLPKPNRSDVPRSELGQMIADGTFYLSCWMTMAQIDQMKSKKVIFHNLNLD